MSGNAVILSGDKQTIPLAPAGANLVQGTASFTPAADMKVAVSLTFPDGQSWQARFTPGTRLQGAQPAPAPAADHGAHRH